LSWLGQEGGIVEGLLFLVECIGIGLILLWIVQNESAGPGERTGGLFAMRSDLPDRKVKAGRRPWVPAAQRPRDLAKRR